MSAKTPDAKSINRISGDDRYATAVAVARDYSATVGDNGLIIASGESPYDALAASSLAGLIDAPIVLVKKDSLPTQVTDFLSDQKAFFQASVGKTIYIIGGTSAISEAVVTAVKAIVHTGDPLTPITVSRIAGADRYATAKLIADTPGLTDSADRMIIVNGADNRWADALSVANLAAENKWPIIMTGDGGLNATAKAAIDAYVALPGSVTEFLLVGAAGVLPTSVNEYLDANDVLPQDIFRRGGADRYQTNFLLNTHALAAAAGGDGAGGVSFDGEDVVLVSGTSPWDALAAGPWAAKKNAHVIISPTAAPSPWATALFGVLTTLNLPNKLYIIGGSSAVANSTRDALVAVSQSRDIGTVTISGCTVGQASILVTFGKAISAGEATLAVGAANSAVWKLNNVTDATANFVTAFTPILTDGSGTALRTTYLISLAAKLALGDVVTFTGIPEDTTVNHKRNIAGASCTAIADQTAPSISLKAVATANDNFDHFIVTLSEAMTNTAGAVDAAGASLAAVGYWKDDGVAMFTAGTQTLSATALNSAGTVFRVSLAANSPMVSMAALSAITIDKEAVVDVAGNTALVAGSATALTDSTKATYSLSAPNCSEDTSGAGVMAIFTRGGLSVTAKSSLLGGSLGGRAANAYKLRVVNQRGIVIPTTTVDSTAKLITVTMDTSYHTAADVVTVAGNSGLTSDWTWGGTTAVSATVADLSPSTKGKTDCIITVTFSEPAILSGAAATVNGVVVTPTVGHNTLRTSTTVSFETTEPGSVSAVITGTVTDAKNFAANANADGTGTITIS